MKSHEADVKLGEGLEIGAVHPAHKKGLVNHLGNHQAESVPAKGMSDHEALGHGIKPKPEMVTYPAHLDAKAQKKAHGFNERSQNGGAEKEGGW
jgi:hypothetical protein